MSKKDRIPRGRDLFKDAMQMTESVTIAQNVSILPERPWTFAEVGRDWAMDTFAISHNAVRRELNDLYGLVVSMVKRKDAVNAEDINNFFVWWPPFAEFILDALLIDHQVRSFSPKPSHLPKTVPDRLHRRPYQSRSHSPRLPS